MNAHNPDAQRPRPPRWVWVLSGLLVASIVLAAIWDWNWFKGPIERRISAATGRTFVIAGDLDVDPGWRPRITANDLRLSNAAWSDEREMASVHRLEMRIALLPLLRGRVDLPYVELDQPHLFLEQDQSKRANWIFGEHSPGGSGRVPLIGQLIVHDGELRVEESLFKTDVRLRVHSGKSSEKNPRAPLLAKGEGTWRGFSFQLEAQVDSPLDLQDKRRPFRVNLRADAGNTHAQADGALRGQLQLQDFEVGFSLSGNNLADLYPQAGLPLPDTPPYTLKGLLGRDGDVWSYHKFKGNVGDSDVSGDVSVTLGNERPKLTATLVSRELDFDDLAGFIGATPQTGPGETAAPEQKAQALQQKAKRTVLPDKPFALDKLRVMDADVTWEATRINAPKLPLERMNAHLNMRDGVLKLNPLDFEAAGGSIASRIEVDARQPSIQTTVVTDVHNLQLQKLFPTVEIAKKGAGLLSGTAAITAQGNSVAYMLGSANGDVGLIMGPGHISNLLVEVAGLDIAESLKYLVDKDREIPLRCAYADFRIVDGEMSSRGLAFDTSDTVIFGQGRIDLRHEALDLRLIPQPKDKSPLVLRVPLKLDGSFKDPSFHPETGLLAARTAAAAALYTLAPPAALLALIETGPGHNIDCGPVANHDVDSSRSAMTATQEQKHRS